MIPRLASLSALFTLLVQGAYLAAEEKVDFNYDIQPIISSKCFHCHGPDEKHREAKLRLDVRDEALREREGVRAIVPGDLTASELITRITSKDRDEVMPPPKELHTLTEHEIELFKRWIEEGAEYKPHWSFVKPARPAVPAAPLFQNSRHPIDAFIAQRLVAAGLKPSREADKATLLRRLTLDLTGLPPTPEEVDAFIKNAAPDSYEKATDRLLASPAYGERWAKMWLDLARYADSTGYGSDKMRLNIWPWRDWVIDAFNRNQPYDQFTIEQLAGDLLPEPTHEQIVATAFHRNTMTNIEGGTDDEEYRVAAIKDRVATTGQVWMGLTFGCAQCHTHKFDPISQREYYQLFAVFNQTEDADREDEDPKLSMATPEQKAALEKFSAEIAEIEKRMKSGTPEFEAEQHEWEAKVSAGGDEAGELPANIRATLAVEPSEREAKQRAELAAHFRPLSKQFAALKTEIEATRKTMAKIEPVALPIMRELGAKKRRTSWLLTKGNFMLHGDEVSAGLPAAFPPAVAGEVDRLALARWIVSPENPLTARVAVNRFWAQLFGTGIVESEEDFGTQGTLPSHPELLDWLAVEFRDNGWDVKRLLKMIVTSATYRQASNVSAEAAQKDPRNRLLAHYPRRRLDAEGVRDQALSLANLLSHKVGGPSVFPPQPDGLWHVAFNGGQDGYPTSAGEDRHRRGIYTFWRRTMPNPTMATFDAPSRETCTIRRIPTNTPLQAFATLNDPNFVECAQALARRIMLEGGTDSASRLHFALRLCLTREPDASQVAALQSLLDAELATYRADADAAKKLATAPLGPLPENTDAAEAAAWTVVANVLLNLDAVLTKS